MSTTIREVAQAAGVSIATVSRVFTGKGPVNDDTRARILEAAERLSYVPHAGARSLITNRTDTIAVLLPEMHGEFFSELIRGIDRVSQERGFQLLVSSSHSDRAGLQAALRATWGRVDGLILMAPDIGPEGLDLEVPGRVPIVLLSAPGKAPGARATLAIDNFGGAAAMVEHLARRGHRRIAFVCGPEQNADARERRRGWRTTVQRLGLDGGPELEIPGDFREESGYRAGEALRSWPRLPDAVFAANDSMAIGVLSALREAGLSVPEDLALAGFDDIPIARYIAPPLTTVRVPILELGLTAVERLLDAIEGGAPRGRGRRAEVLPTELVIRHSCGAEGGRP